MECAINTKRGRVSIKTLIIYILSIVCFTPSIKSNARVNDNNPLLDSVVLRVDRQLELFPQEKIYVHNDKSVYLTGEKVWFRIHLVDAFSHRYDTTSMYVYGELADPEGKIVDRVKIIRREGIYSGYFDLAETLPDGAYTMCFYTKYMQNMGEESLFKRSITLVNPSSAICRVEPNFEYLSNNKIKVDLRFFDNQSNQTFFPKSLSVSSGKEELKTRKTDDRGVLSFELSSTKNTSSDLLYLEYEYNGKKLCQYLHMPSVSNDYDIKILPEGGRLLYGVQNKVAFKAIDTKGIGEDVSLSVIEEKGDTILKSSSVNKGMGTFDFTPQKGKDYTLLSTNKNNIVKKIRLTPSIEEGCALSVYPLSEHIVAKVNMTDPQSAEELYLIAHSRGKLLYLNRVKKDQSVISFEKMELPSGIINFLLLDDAMNPISERLIFNKSPRSELKAALKSNRQKYKKRELVKAKFSLSDMFNEKQVANASVSVVDDRDVKVDSTQNIVSTLLLSSELKGRIENPSMYLEDNRKTEFLLDLLMLTHGWRRYNMEKVLQGDIEVPTIPIEETNIISGQVKSGFLFGGKAKGVDVNVFTLDPFSSETFETDEKGCFSVGGYDLPDTTIYSIRAVTKNGGENLELTLNEEKIAENRNVYLSANKLSVKGLELEDPIQNYIREFIAKADKKYMIENGARTIDLPEVKVLGQKGKQMYTDSKFSIGFGKIYAGEDISRYDMLDVPQLLRSMGVYLGVDEFGRYTDDAFLRPNSHSVSFVSRGKSGALILVNDMKNPYFITSGFPVKQIKEVEIIKGTMAAALLGREALAGAILITTKDNVEVANRKYNYINFTPLGYQQYAEFYVPKYDTPQAIASEVLDLRTTIHWQPSLEIVNGEGEIEFYTSDTATEYSVVIEGITADGMPFQYIDKITVE